MTRDCHWAVSNTNTHKTHLSNDVDAVYEDGGVVPVRAEGHVEHRSVLGVVDLLAVEHGIDLEYGNMWNTG